jgi:ferredoxin
MPHFIDTKSCIQCKACLSACPVEAIVFKDNKVIINPDECVNCQTCWRICPQKCVSKL